MEFLNFKRIFWNYNEKYMFYQKLRQTKVVDLIETNNFANLSFFRISQIIVKALPFFLNFFQLIYTDL